MPHYKISEKFSNNVMHRTFVLLFHTMRLSFCILINNIHYNKVDQKIKNEV